MNNGTIMIFENYTPMNFTCLIKGVLWVILQKLQD